MFQTEWFSIFCFVFVIPQFSLFMDTGQQYHKETTIGALLESHTLFVEPTPSLPNRTPQAILQRRITPTCCYFSVFVVVSTSVSNTMDTEVYGLEPARQPFVLSWLSWSKAAKHYDHDIQTEQRRRITSVACFVIPTSSLLGSTPADNLLDTGSRHQLQPRTTSTFSSIWSAVESTPVNSQQHGRHRYSSRTEDRKRGITASAKSHNHIAVYG